MVLPGAPILRAEIRRRTSLVTRTQTVYTAEYLPGNFEISFEQYLFGKRFLDLDLAHNRDIIDGLPNYDVIPASISNVGIGEAGEKLPDGRLRQPWYFTLFSPGGIGLITVFYSAEVELPGKYYAYVPTQSAQNLPISLTPSSSTAGFDTDDGVVSNLEMLEIPDDYQGPTSSHNHEHVVFTPQLVVFFLDHVLGAEITNSQPRGLNGQIVSPYNFGTAASGVQTPSLVGGTHVITSTGKFLIGHSDRIFYTTNFQNPQNAASHFDVELSNGECNVPLADITLQSGAEFLVGQGSSHTATVTALPGTRVTIEDGGYLNVDRGSNFYLHSNGPDGQAGIVVEAGGLLKTGETAATSNGGRLYIDGGTLLVKSGGQLRVKYNGQIVARNGGQIILEDGALLQLWDGDNLEGDGFIHIADGGTLEIQGEYSYSGSGYFRFSAGNTILGPGALVIQGDGQEYRRMVVEEHADVDLGIGPGTNPVSQDFFVRDAKIIYENGGSVRAFDGSEVDVRRATFEGNPFGAVVTDGSAPFFVRLSDFIGGDGAYYRYAEPDDGGAPFTVSNCTFTDCNSGVIVHSLLGSDVSDVHPSIDGSTFKDCDYGLYVEDYPTVTAEHCSFTSVHANTIAVEAYGTEDIYLTDCTVTGYSGSVTHGALYLTDAGEIHVAGGLYANNTNVAYMERASDVIFSKCVDVLDNVVAVKNPGYTNAPALVAFDGATVTGNTHAVEGDYFTILSSSANTFGLGSDYFLDIDVSTTVPFPLEDNLWIGSTLNTGFPLQNQWFCVKTPNTGSGCYNNPVTVTTISQGCGSDCLSPESCDEFCEYFPDHPWCEPKGGGQVERGSFAVYPNPSAGQVTLEFEEATGGEIIVTNMQGSHVHTQDLRASTIHTLDLHHLPTGMYNLQLQNGDATTQLQRIVVAE